MAVSRSLTADLREFAEALLKDRPNSGAARVMLEAADEVAALLARTEAAEKALAALADAPFNDTIDGRAAYVEFVRCVARDGLRLAGSSPAAEAETGLPPGYIVPAADERCDFVMDACTCMKRKGHDDLHACAHGGWRSVQRAGGVSDSSEAKDVAADGGFASGPRNGGVGESGNASPAASAATDDLGYGTDPATGAIVGPGSGVTGENAKDKAGDDRSAVVESGGETS